MRAAELNAVVGRFKVKKSAGPIEIVRVGHHTRGPFRQSLLFRHHNGRSRFLNFIGLNPVKLL